jgi:hypothetical protein
MPLNAVEAQFEHFVAEFTHAEIMAGRAERATGRRRLGQFPVRA